MLTHQQVKHIAQLARLELSEDELKKYPIQLGKILDYFEKLKQVKTTGVPIGTADGGTRDLYNVWREDNKEIKKLEIKKLRDLVNMAPEKEKDQIKVKSVF